MSHPHHFHSRFWLFLLMLLSATLACKLVTPDEPIPTEAPPAATETSTPTEAPAISLGEETRFEDQGFAFQPLPDYQLDTSFGVQLLAPDADPDTGPAFMLVGGTAEEGTSASSLIQSLVSSEVAISELQPITVDGYEGLAADIQRTTGNLAGRAVAIMVTPQQQFALFGIAPKDQWDAEIAPLFEALLGSVKLFEMQAAAQSSDESAPGANPVELTNIRQWGSRASASSEYSSGNWSAAQATGAPNVNACGDDGNAWAAANSNTVEWLEISFDVPVEPTQVNVHLSYNPIHIVKMELIDLKGISHQIYEFEARSYPECPTVFNIDVNETGFQADMLRITIDQTASPGFVEIDAVELVGLGDASLLANNQPAEQPESPPPVVSGEIPPGFLWRTGGKKTVNAVDQFPGLWGLDVDPKNAVVYIADAVYDIRILDAVSGQPVGQFNHPEMRVPQDVKVDALGNVYVAAWGSGKILVFPPNGQGEPFAIFGERGRGDGQFGEYSPTHLAVGLDGRIYAHDRNQNEKDEYYNRILVFSPQGQWLQTIQFEENYFTPGGMDVGPDGNLYVVGFVGSRILKYSPDGELLATLGEDAIRSVTGGPQGIALDAAGNFYLALWTGGIVQLGPEGNMMGQWGQQAKDGTIDWPAGSCHQPAGIAVWPDGSMVYFSDTSSQYTYLTSITFLK